MTIVASTTQPTTLRKPTPSMVEPVPQRPGKSGMAVGQLAKQVVSAARAAGIELPKNAQGVAASQIARGASPESIFAVQVEENTSVLEEGTAEDAGTMAPTTPEAIAPNPTEPLADETARQVEKDIEEDRALIAAVQYDAASSGIAASGDSAAQIALDLLS